LSMSKHINEEYIRCAAGINSNIRKLKCIAENFNPISDIHNSEGNALVAGALMSAANELSYYCEKFIDSLAEELQSGINTIKDQKLHGLLPHDGEIPLRSDE
jgi:hypothetical protein